MRRLLYLLLVVVLSCCSSQKPHLHVYTWGDYIKPELLDQFEKEFQCKIVLDTYDSNESMYAKLKAGASGYDIIFPTSYIIAIMEDQGMLQVLDEALIPNLAYIDHHYLSLINEKSYPNSVPFAVTFSGIAYRKDRVIDPISSWGIFGERSLKGRMTMLNDPRETIGAALKYLGFSINTINPAEIDAATNQLLVWKKNLAKYESEQYKNGIASAEYLVAQGYSGDVMQLIEEDEDVGFLLPHEGSVFSCDSMTIPKGAHSHALAHAFINFLLRPEVAAENMAANYYRCPNTAAYELLSKELLDNPVIFPAHEFLQKSEIIYDLGENIRLYTEAWDRLKK